MVLYTSGQATWPSIDPEHPTGVKVYDTFVKKVFDKELTVEEAAMLTRCDPGGKCIQNLKILYANQQMKKAVTVSNRKLVSWLKPNWFPHLYKQIGSIILYWSVEIEDEDLTDRAWGSWNTWKAGFMLKVSRKQGIQISLTNHSF